jgi:hypothetical protein
MMIQDYIKESGLDIQEGVYMLYRNAEGKEIYNEWDELDELTQAQMSELAYQAERIMEKAGKFLKA